MKAFKHIDRSVNAAGVQFVDQFASGQSINIGLHSYYRHAELGARSDRGEGIVTYCVPAGDKWFMAKPTASDIEKMSRMGIIVAEKGVTNITIDNVSFTKPVAEHYLFCCSIAPDWRMAERENLRVFRISDIDEFARPVASANSMFLGPPRCRPVIYGSKRVDVRSPVDDGPFVKAMRFRFENELRLAWPSLASDPWKAVQADVAALIEEISE